MAKEGLKIRLSRIPGVTPRGYLTTTYYFQCPPLDEFSVPHAHDHTNYMTIKNGEYSRKGGRLLRTASFETLVTWWAPWVVRDLPGNLDDMKDRLEHIVNRGYVVRFQAAHSFRTDADAFWADWPATLRGFTPSERAGEPDARYFSCEFHEWRDPTVSRKGRGKKRSGSRDFPRTHTLDANDTMHSIAKKYYGPWGGAQSWRWIADGNGLKNWGPGTPLVRSKRFKVGDKIKVPAPKLKAIVRDVPEPRRRESIRAA